MAFPIPNGATYPHSTRPRNRRPNGPLIWYERTSRAWHRGTCHQSFHTGNRNRYHTEEVENAIDRTLQRNFRPRHSLTKKTQHMLMSGATEGVLCKCFPLFLSDIATTWFCRLPQGSICSWEMLKEKFIGQFRIHVE